MNKFKRSIAAAVMLVALLSQAFASTSESWNVYFISGAPGSINHQDHYINNMGYDEDGYYSYTSYINGANDRYVSVTQASMSTLIITTTGNSATRKVYVYVAYPEFHFQGNSASSINANGTWNKK